MNIDKRLKVLTTLGDFLLSESLLMEGAIHKAYLFNPWFTPDNIKKSLHAIVLQMLSIEKLENWIANYQIATPETPKNIAIISAGNIPLVNFHDILCVFITGHHVQVKLSEKDQYLLPAIIQALTDIEPSFKKEIQIVERITGQDAVIATGSNNTGRYFEYYFGKKPHIIRKNRNSMAVLSGDETEQALQSLGHDIFDYFGLGCRNVSLLFCPKDYDLSKLKQPWAEWNQLLEHHKYKSNLDYQRTVYLMNSIPMEDFDFANIVHNAHLASPISCLHIHRYEHEQEIVDFIEQQAQHLQCVVSENSIPFGKSQEPHLADYADNVDVIDFLLKL